MTRNNLKTSPDKHPLVGKTIEKVEKKPYYIKITFTDKTEIIILADMKFNRTDGTWNPAIEIQ